MDTTINQGQIPLLKWKSTRVLVVSGTIWEKKLIPCTKWTLIQKKNGVKLSYNIIKGTE